jgi:signal transduction histidine kinase/HPt (histidine-containing phosphotransfer) domain-containing protein/ActR/RegA family two-component response regulator
MTTQSALQDANTVTDPSDLRRKEYMDLLFANTPESILIFDKDGRLARCTHVFLHLIQVKDFKQIEGMSFKKLYLFFGDEALIHDASQRYEAVKKGRKTLTRDVLLNFPAHEGPRFYTVHAAPLQDEQGQLDGFIVQFHDSTEHAQAEADERTRAMLDATPLATSLWGEDLEPIDCNQVTLRMLDISSASEFKKNIPKLMPLTQPDGEISVDIFYNLIRTAFSTGREERELFLQTSDGAPIPSELSFVRIGWGGHYGVVCYARDLRALRASQEAMREADERTHAMLDATPLACSFWDEDINLIDCNQGCLKLYGIASKEEYLKRFHEISPELQPDGSLSMETILHNTRMAFKTGQRSYEWMHLNLTTGRHFLTDVVLKRVPWKNGFRVVSYVRDISKSKENEARRREAEQRSRELEVQTRAAKVASEAKSNFLATMSHEIRTPMNAIIGMSELINTDNLDEHQRSFINDIRKMSRSLLHIINGILDFAKIEAGKLELNPVHFNILELYDNICSINRFTAESKDLHFTSSFDTDVPHALYGDDVRIRQVVTNILNNAIKYTRQGEVSFRVAYARQGNKPFLSFTVADTGIGIKRENFNKLFDAFEQLDPASRNQLGTGLGLAITHNLVTMMKGRIELESEYGKGSTFTVFLPLVLGDPKKVKAPEAEIQAVEARNAKVLVVDDNQINLKVGLAYLLRYGITADAAYSGLEAIEKVKRNDYDLVLMDQMMPEMDGLETTQKIRELSGQKYQKLIIVALSANAVRGVNRIFLDAGMNDFIPKPIESHELVRILTKWLPAEKLTIKVAPSLQCPIAPIVEKSFIQRAVGLKNVANDENLYRSILHDFVANHANDIKSLHEMLAQGDLATARRLTHTLKSTSSLLGAQTLRHIAAIVENELGDGKKDDTHLAALEANFNGVMAELAILTQTPQPVRQNAASTNRGGADKESVDKISVLALLDKLEPLLASSNTSCLSFTSEIQRALAPMGDERGGLIIQQMEDFDFNCAQETLLSLRNALNGEKETKSTKEYDL